MRLKIEFLFSLTSIIAWVTKKSNSSLTIATYGITISLERSVMNKKYRWGFLGKFWRKRQRNADRLFLFPCILETSVANKAFISGNIEIENFDDVDSEIKKLIALHCYIDSAWRFTDEWKNEPEWGWIPQIWNNLNLNKGNQF